MIRDEDQLPMMRNVILNDVGIKLFSTKQIDLWIEFGFVEACDREEAIEQFIERAKRLNRPPATQ
jgi:hypothetical protein